VVRSRIAESEIREYRDSTFDAQQYLQYLGRHLRFIMIVCAAAGVLALIASMFLPKQYTATASVAIDPPAGNDPRGSTVVSPMYFESLRAYELVAASDSLFLRGAEKFHLRDSRPLEALKRRILKVTKVRDTKILEIAVTLPDAKQAQAFAQFLAEATVEQTRSHSASNDQEILADAQRQVDEAQTRLDREQAAWYEFSKREPAEASIRADLQALTITRENVERDLGDARLQLSEVSATPSDPRLAGVQSRVRDLETRDAELGRQIQAKGSLSSAHDAQSDAFQERLKVTQKGLEGAEGKLHEVQASAGTRGDRLHVIDPGVVPEQPSAPNIGLNVALALAVACFACLTYLTLTFRALTFRASE
jgi:capsular polysaccharide biosynthesis protein